MNLKHLQINSTANQPNSTRQQDYIANAIYSTLSHQAQQTQRLRNQQRSLQQSAILAKPFSLIGYQPHIGY